MIAYDLLADLRSRGIVLQTDGQRLRWQPAFMVSEDLALRILQFRSDLVLLLTEKRALPACPRCRWVLDSGRRCPKCFDRLCEVCGRMTGSYFLMRCIACEGRNP